MVSTSSTTDLAPLDEIELKQSLLPFGQSRMLPKAAYLDDAVLDWERRNIFGDGWVCVGRADELAEGSMRTYPVGEFSVLVVRDGDDLRAFENACRHRGHELLPCGGSAHGRRVMVCPYHAWTYNLDGSLKAAPRFEEEAVQGMGLNAVPVVDWHGWLF
ncbi:MAG: aromatic ring-hydroxylating oxygenase subunit alpha, partial [Actinomycetes bacterium]